MFRRRDRREKTDAEDDVLEVETDAELEDDEPAERLEDQPEDMTADLDSQAADYLAGNDVWMYGPNAEAVLEILDRLEEIVPDQARPLAEAWLAIPKSDRDRARKAVRKLAEDDEEIFRHLQLVREAVGTWMAVTGSYPEFVNAEENWARMCGQTGEAALDAATAVILEGKLDESHYEALLEPWSETMAQLDAAADVAALEGPDTAEDESDESEDEELDDEEDEGKFGPNSDSVTDFLNRLWLLAPEQVGRLVSGWQNVDRKDLKTAHEGLRAVVDEDPDWRDQVRRAQEELAPWLNAGRIQDTAGFLGQAGQGESRKMAGPALADAIAALVLGDLLKRSHAELLYGPWFNLIGAPLLPAAEDAVETVSAAKVAKAPKGGAKQPAASEPKSAKAATTAKATTAKATTAKATTAKATTAKAAKPKTAARSTSAGGSKPTVKPTTKGGVKPAARPTTTVKSTKK
jgi:hypothetical protein